MRKQIVDVTLHNLKLSAETGLCFTENNVEFVLFGVLKHTAEGRPVAVCTAVIIVNVYVVNFPAMGKGVLRQKLTLVLNAVAVVIVRQLVFVLLGQSAVNYGLFRYYSSRILFVCRLDFSRRLISFIHISVTALLSVCSVPSLNMLRHWALFIDIAPFDINVF